MADDEKLRVNYTQLYYAEQQGQWGIVLNPTKSQEGFSQDHQGRRLLGAKFGLV